MLVREQCSCAAYVEAETNDLETMQRFVERWRNDHKHEIPKSVGEFSVGRLGFASGWPAEWPLSGFSIIPPEQYYEGGSSEHVDDPAAKQ